MQTRMLVAFFAMKAHPAASWVVCCPQYLQVHLHNAGVGLLHVHLFNLVKFSPSQCFSLSRSLWTMFIFSYKLLEESQVHDNV